MTQIPVELSKIGTLDDFVGSDLGGCPFGQNRPLVHHGDLVRNAHDYIHVVFHQHYGFISGLLHLADQLN